MKAPDSSSKTRLQDLPREFFPRERLIDQGSQVLSNAELVALFLRTGIKGKNVLEVATDLLQAAGSLATLASMDCRQISNVCKGIGLAKASTLVAAFELGGRALRESVQNEPMNDPKKVYDYLYSRTAHLLQEKIYVLVLDTRMRLITCKEVSHGILNESLAHPREILRPVIVNNGHSFILAHNHPSGDPSPSSSDDELTQAIKSAGELLETPLLDHIILGKPSPSREMPYYSYRRARVL